MMSDRYEAGKFDDDQWPLYYNKVELERVKRVETELSEEQVNDVSLDFTLIMIVTTWLYNYIVTSASPFQCIALVLFTKALSGVKSSGDWRYLQCTMQLSYCKNGNRRFKPDFHHSTHFLPVWLFQTNYLEIGLCPVSLLKYIWGLVEHSQLPKKDLQ